MSIHPTSIIDPSAKIASDVQIGPFCTIGEDVQIESGSEIISHAVIKGPTVIGKDNCIYQFSTIGDDTPDKKFKGEKTKLIIGDNNIFREGVTIHRGTIQDNSVTTIGSNNLFMPFAHVAHDCIVGNDNIFANLASLAGHVYVGNNVTIGGITTVHQRCKLGDFCFAGMNSSITMDVPAYVKVASDPARVVGINSVGMSRRSISDESISNIKKAYKLVYRKNLKIQEALIELSSLFEQTQDIHIENFIKSIQTSERGILR
jgi:UDP-N-acetylglucosamine acyltransferase